MAAALTLPPIGGVQTASVHKVSGRQGGFASAVLPEPSGDPSRPLLVIEAPLDTTLVHGNNREAAAFQAHGEVYLASVKRGWEGVNDGANDRYCILALAYPHAFARPAKALREF